MSLVTQVFKDQTYVGLPWKAGGNTVEGLDCRGLAMMWLKQEMGWEAPEVPSHPESDETAERIIREAIPNSSNSSSGIPTTYAGIYSRGDVVFFRHKGSGKVRHVAIALGNNRFLHILRGHESRIDTGLVLMYRLGLEPVGVLNPVQSQWLAEALSDRKLGDAGTITLLVISIALSAASAFLMPKPKLGNFRAETGRYGFDNLYTRSDPQVPLPDILGAVTVAGNSPYQSIVDKSQNAISDPTQQKANKVVIVASGPVEAMEYDSQVMRVNGRVYSDAWFHASGIKLDPAQTKAEAVDGTISSEYNRPSVSVYDGAHDISVPVDVRAQYDRNFPIYGFSGCAYAVFRLIDSTKFDQFNLNVTVKGRHCRTFTSSGFDVTSVAGESLSGADGSKVRFKLANEDIKEVTAITVNGTSYTQATEDQQAGYVYRLNTLKGYVEFFTAPAAAATISIDYDYYPREWTQNPASHLIYLLTETMRGKGYPEDRIDWEAAETLRDYCSGTVVWQHANGSSVEDRFTSNYVLDIRRPIQEHVRSVLDACYAYLFLSNGKFVAKARRDAASVFDFDTTNILKDSFSSEVIDRTQLANRVKVFYHAKETFNAETEVVREDRDDQADRESYVGNEGVVEETLRMLAVDREGQAQRLAQTVLEENVSAVWVAEWKSSVKGLAIQPGDVVTITHPSQPSWASKEFRVEDVTFDAEGRHVYRGSEYFEAAYR